jgi:hypothetical protein
MEKGDDFIFYGEDHAIRGKVESTFEKLTYDLKNGVRVATPYIISTDGKTYNEKLCFQIKSEIGSNFLKKLLKIFNS